MAEIGLAAPAATFRHPCGSPLPRTRDPPLRVPAAAAGFVDYLDPCFTLCLLISLPLADQGFLSSLLFLLAHVILASPSPSFDLVLVLLGVC